MSSTTHNLPYTRFTRQVRTEPQALLATDVAAANALTMLKSADWVQRADETDVTFPARSAVQDGFNPLWDAFKHVGNYSAGYQRAYAGMVAYRFQVPADALTGPTNLTSIAVPLNVDRWLVDGVRVAAYASDSAVPSADWDTLRTGDVNLEGQLPMTYTEDDPPQRIVVEKSDTLTLTFPGSTASKKYLYVVVSLEDYTTTRGFWIEGASLIQGQNTVTTFANAVDADPPLWLPDVAVNVSTTGIRRHTITGPTIQGVGAFDGYDFAYASANPEHAQPVWDSVIGNHDIGAYGSGALISHVGLSGNDSDGKPYARLGVAVSHLTIHPSKAGTKTGLIFIPYPVDSPTVSIPKPSTNIVGRIVVYYLPGNVFGTTDYVGHSADRVIAPTTELRRAFWDGTASQVSRWDGTEHTECTAVPLLSVEVDRDYPIGHKFPINTQADSDGTIVIGTTISKVTGTVTFSGGTGKGWNFIPWCVQLV